MVVIVRKEYATVITCYKHRFIKYWIYIIKNKMKGYKVSTLDE